MPIDTIIIAAGGRGRRFFSNDGQHNLGKACIAYADRPLLWYVCASAKKAGITNFCISYNPDNLHIVEAVVASLELSVTLRKTTPGFRGVAGLFSDRIQELAIFACGHHIIPWEHFVKLRYSDLGASLYSLPSLTPLEKHLIPHNTGAATKEKLGPTIPNRYIESPYVVNKQLTNYMSKHHRNTSWQSIYFERWKNGQNVNFITANFPSEFDWPEQFSLTEKVLENQCKQLLES